MKWLSRKFLLVVASLAAGIVLAWVGHLTTDFVALVGTLNISYHASNVWGKNSGNGP